jgi:hypothetical protein
MDTHGRWNFNRLTALNGAWLLWILSAPGFAATANHAPRTDLPGIISSKDLESGVAALKAADVEFYVTVMRATLERYQHPSAKDLADMAEAKRLTQRQMAAQAKVAEDMKAGNSQKAMADMFQPTPEEAAALDRGNALARGGVADLVAGEAGMPLNQWDKLSNVVQHAAGLDGDTGSGSGDAGQTSTLTPAQQVRAQDIQRVRAANRDLVAPSVPELKRLKSATDAIILERVQKISGP